MQKCFKLFFDIFCDKTVYLQNFKKRNIHVYACSQAHNIQASSHILRIDI